jgi:hypothetical protein
LHAGTTGGAHGFVIKEVGGPVHAAVNADTGFYPASAIKLVHFVHSLGWIAGGGDPATPVTVYDDGCAGGGPGHDEPLEQLLAKTMLLSDNAAANAIQSHFGLQELARTVDDAGMTGTRLVHGFGCGGPANDPANRTTSIDLVRLLEGVADGSAVSPDQWPLAESLLADATAAAGFGPNEGVRVLVKDRVRPDRRRRPDPGFRRVHRRRRHGGSRVLHRRHRRSAHRRGSRRVRACGG